MTGLSQVGHFLPFEGERRQRRCPVPKQKAYTQRRHKILACPESPKRSVVLTLQPSLRHLIKWRAGVGGPSAFLIPQVLISHAVEPALAPQCRYMEHVIQNRHYYQCDHRRKAQPKYNRAG